MKRLLCLALVLCLLLCGCSISAERMKEPVVFYYVRENYQKDMEEVIGSEMREASGHRGDLSYLLALYSMGPADENLKSLLPRNTTITVTEHADKAISLFLSDNAHTMADVEFTLASTCIALTCMDLTDARQVTVVCEDRTITVREDQLLLYSDFPQKSQEETK